MKLTQDQKSRLVGVWNGRGLIQDVIDLYESEMRPEAAPVMWRRSNTGSRDTIAFSDGSIVIRRDEIPPENYGKDRYELTREDLLSIPFPADPTPEEKAEAEFEAFWGNRPTLGYSTNDLGARMLAKAAFMAAKFPAGKEGK